MKKLFTVLLLMGIFFLANNVLAQTLYPPDQATIAWDATTTLSNGNAIPVGDTVQYEIYLSNDGLTGTSVGTTSLLQYTLTFTGEGIFFVGVSARRIPSGTILANCNDQTCPISGVTWSNSTDIAAVPVPFGFINYLAPKSITGLRKP